MHLQLNDIDTSRINLTELKHMEYPLPVHKIRGCKGHNQAYLVICIWKGYVQSYRYHTRWQAKKDRKLIKIFSERNKGDKK